MSSRPRLLLLVLVLLVVAGVARARDLHPADITVRAGTDFPDSALRSAVVIVPGDGGSRFLTVTLTNDSPRTVRLRSLAFEFPWAESLPVDTPVATGGACMFESPTLVTTAGSAPLESRTFLARETSGYTFAGLVTWRAFRTTLSWSAWIFVRADGEGRTLAPGASIALETLWLAPFADWSDALFAYAAEIVRHQAIHLKPPPDWRGWSNWDYYGAGFTADQVLENLHALAALPAKFNLLQIDGGWWSGRGDFLEAREGLEGRMPALAAAIRARGLTAGIHLDGMRADPRSAIARQHPEYFLHDVTGRLVEHRTGTGSRARGEIYFDYSHPGACAYMEKVVHTLHHDWGYDYFKFDFLKFGLPDFILGEIRKSGGDPRPLAPHDPGLTSFERYHRALAAFRAGMGPEGWLLACTAEFGPTYGECDSLRTGGDIDPTYSRYTRSCTENAGMFFLHHVVVYQDTDYIVVRDRHDEDAALVRNPRKTGGDNPLSLSAMWADYAALFSCARLSGDNLTILRPARTALFLRALDLPACDRYLPLDFWRHARDRDDPFGIFLGRADDRVILAFFNWSADARTYRLTGPATAALAHAEALTGDTPLSVTAAGASVTLPGRHSVVFRLRAGADFDDLRHRLVLP